MYTRSHRACEAVAAEFAETNKPIVSMGYGTEHSHFPTAMEARRHKLGPKAVRVFEDLEAKSKAMAPEASNMKPVQVSGPEERKGYGT